MAETAKGQTTIKMGTDILLANILFLTDRNFFHKNKHRLIQKEYKLG